jgi:hypothetical protein
MFINARPYGLEKTHDVSFTGRRRRSLAYKPASMIINSYHYRDPGSLSADRKWQMIASR